MYVCMYIYIYMYVRVCVYVCISRAPPPGAMADPRGSTPLRADHGRRGPGCACYRVRQDRSAFCTLDHGSSTCGSSTAAAAVFEGELYRRGAVLTKGVY